MGYTKMINFIATEPEGGIRNLAGRIAGLLNDGYRVLWLVAGGSNIPIAVKVMAMIRDDVKPNRLKNLTVSQTDERYGSVGHADSNWQQLIVNQFDITGVRTLTVLRDLSLEQTELRWSEDIENALASSDVSIGQFGIGADGHIAGILPDSPALHENRKGKKSVVAYKACPFIRVTLTPAIIKRLNEAHVFAYGESKIKALKDLREKDLSLAEQPAQILKSVKDATIYMAAV